jgi:hypothetical protein
MYFEKKYIKLLKHLIIIMKLVKFIKWQILRKECFYCKKFKFKTHDIPVYNDLHHLHCNMTLESYKICYKCLIELLHNNTIVISLKSIIKTSVIETLMHPGIDVSQKTRKDISDLQTTLKSETKFHNNTNYLTDQENSVFKDITNKVSNTRRVSV